MPEEEPVQKKKQKGKPQREVRLISSALFFTDDNPVPAGIRARDIGAMVEGMVDEHSPMPIEQTSWGFLLDNRSKKKNHIFYYAAPRELVFTQAADASNLEMAGVLPGFAALHGIQFRKSTWVFLLEAECMTAVLLENNSPVPSNVVSKFIPRDAIGDTEKVYEFRSELVRKVVDLENDNLVDGLVRVQESVDAGKKGIAFHLEHQENKDADWKKWKKSELRKLSRIRAADVREHGVLEAQNQRKNSGLRVLQAAAFILIIIAGLAYLEYELYQQKLEVTRLSEIEESQEPLVERLQEIEAMNKSLKNIFQKNFSPYRWMMIINETRPPEISIVNYTIDDAGKITTSGIGPEIKALNSYIETLQQNVKFESVEILKVDTDKSGVSFSLNIQTGDIDAEPEAPVEAQEPTETAPVETAAAPKKKNPNKKANSKKKNDNKKKAKGAAKS